MFNPGDLLAPDDGEVLICYNNVEQAYKNYFVDSIKSIMCVRQRDSDTYECLLVFNSEHYEFVTIHETHIYAL